MRSLITWGKENFNTLSQLILVYLVESRYLIKQPNYPHLDVNMFFVIINSKFRCVYLLEGISLHEGYNISWHPVYDCLMLFVRWVGLKLQMKVGNRKISRNFLAELRPQENEIHWCAWVGARTCAWNNNQALLTAARFSTCKHAHRSPERTSNSEAQCLDIIKMAEKKEESERGRENANF